MKRFTVDNRFVEDDYDEWCIIDEDVSPCGAMVAGRMTLKDAERIAKLLNEEEK